MLLSLLKFYGLPKGKVDLILWSHLLIDFVQGVHSPLLYFLLFLPSFCPALSSNVFEVLPLPSEVFFVCRLEI